jgi:hypothetical protein
MVIEAMFMPCELTKANTEKELIYHTFPYSGKVDLEMDTEGAENLRVPDPAEL